VAAEVAAVTVAAAAAIAVAFLAAKFFRDDAGAVLCDFFWCLLVPLPLLTLPPRVVAFRLSCDAPVLYDSGWIGAKLPSPRGLLCVGGGMVPRAASENGWIVEWPMDLLEMALGSTMDDDDSVNGNAPLSVLAFCSYHLS
jgi:hypothetical protein